MADINRNGVDLATLAVGKLVGYQVGTKSEIFVGRIYEIRSTCVMLTDHKVISKTYILGVLNDYKPPYQAPYQSPEEVLYIARARADGQPIYCRMKIEGHPWQKCEGKFQFNFSSLEYRVGPEVPQL